MARRRIEPSEHHAVAEFVERTWPGQVVFSRGRCYAAHELDGYAEWREGRMVGLLTWVKEGEDLHLLTLSSAVEGQHVATGLMLMAIDQARREGVRRIWFSTTNDNLRLMGFYQRLGFRLTAVYVGAVDEVRKIQPKIPEIGHDGIAVHDELVLELDLQPRT